MDRIFIEFLEKKYPDRYAQGGAHKKGIDPPELKMLPELNEEQDGYG